MLEIVKKRAALRPSDTMVGSDGGYDVSDDHGDSGLLRSTCSSLHPSSPIRTFSLLDVTDDDDFDDATGGPRNSKVQLGAFWCGLLAVVVFFLAFGYHSLFAIECVED